MKEVQHVYTRNSVKFYILKAKKKRQNYYMRDSSLDDETVKIKEMKKTHINREVPGGRGWERAHRVNLYYFLS